MTPRSDDVKLTAAEIRRLLELLDGELAEHGVIGELMMVGGAVMCLVFEARAATNDVDALFRPARVIRESALRVAAQAGIHNGWLNDAVKGSLSPRGEFVPFLDLPNLRVFVARADYVFAMKCAALRLGAEFHDLDDVRYLLRYLNITTVDEALDTVHLYFDDAELLPKTRLALEELLTPRSPAPHRT